jgi:cysteine synthase A
VSPVREQATPTYTRTTAQEILADFAGESLDYWVTGFGTGALKGVSRARKSTATKSSRLTDNSQVLSGIPQPRAASGAVTQSRGFVRT